MTFDSEMWPFRCHPCTIEIWSFEQFKIQSFSLYLPLFLFLPPKSCKRMTVLVHNPGLREIKQWKYIPIVSSNYNKSWFYMIQLSFFFFFFPGYFHLLTQWQIKKTGTIYVPLKPHVNVKSHFSCIYLN